MPVKYGNPRDLWDNKTDYDTTLNSLYTLFKLNYKKYDSYQS